MVCAHAGLLADNEDLAEHGERVLDQRDLGARARHHHGERAFLARRRRRPKPAQSICTMFFFASVAAISMATRAPVVERSMKRLTRLP